MVETAQKFMGHSGRHFGDGPSFHDIPQGENLGHAGPPTPPAEMDPITFGIYPTSAKAIRGLRHMVGGTVDITRKYLKAHPYGQRGWVPTDIGRVYVRVSQVAILREVVPAICIASVMINDRFQRRGIFKSYLRWVEAFADSCGMYVTVENVLNEHLADYLRKRAGYGLMYPDCLELSFYRAPVRKDNAG